MDLRLHPPVIGTLLYGKGWVPSARCLGHRGGLVESLRRDFRYLLRHRVHELVLVSVDDLRFVLFYVVDALFDTVLLLLL